MKTKEQMIDEVIRTFGHENGWTIWFCGLADHLSEEELREPFRLVMEKANEA